MKKIVTVAFLAIFIITGLLFLAPYIIVGGRTVNITDVTKEEIIILSAKGTEQNVHGIKIVVIGNIKGEATIYRYYHDGRIYKEYAIKEKVCKFMGGEYYSNTCKLKYKPSNVTSGRLRIKYKFKTIKPTPE